MSVGATITRARYRGCLLGHAVGDALGAPVEFVSRPAILAMYGPNGLTGFVPWCNESGHQLPRGSVTDDTQMSIATAEGLIDAADRYRSTGLADPSEPVWLRYRGWLEAQDDPRLRRYPGATCVTAIAEGRPGDLDDPLNDRKGSGGVMRVAPVGLAYPPERAFEEGAALAALTHGHASGWLSAGFLADTVARLAQGRSGRSRGDEGLSRIQVAVAETREVLLGWEQHDEVLEKVDVAVELFMSDASLDEGFSALGEGWIAEEALGIALFSALNFPEDFAEGVLAAVNITGDSDTTGCLTGALLGACLGDSSIPGNWLMDLEGASRIAGLADGLYDLFVADGQP